ncbi:MerR family transcriptional regulator [Marinisporobacter balticus]|uniref:Excisionase family DNA binding protein n=1 Tax=Marinisporobacter balticus TaxID=2018667 RepID=A0A4R2L646_9FIRM|nr:hypothetical protein [Marinisporobacter balticus]TCO79426.1 excisionase family DNA binding protein [Marinisporobacter balticus]
MDLFEFEKYYSADEVAKIFKVRTIAVINRIKSKKEFYGKWLLFENVYYIKKDIIDKIMYSREISMTVKEVCVALNRSKDTILDMIKQGRLDYFRDQWNNRNYRIYTDNIKEIMLLKENYYTVEQLGKIFKITNNNIRKKIKRNYCDVKDFMKDTTSRKIYIKKTFIDNYEELQCNSTFLDEAAKELGIKQNDLYIKCSNIDENSIFTDFVTGKLKLKNMYMDMIRNNEVNIEFESDNGFVELQSLIWQMVMTEEEIKDFILTCCNLDMYEEIKIINGKKYISSNRYQIIIEKFNEFFAEKKNDTNFVSQDANSSEFKKLDGKSYISLEDIKRMFGVSPVTIARRIRRNCCNVQKYKKQFSKKILIRGEFFYYLRKKQHNSVLLKLASQELKMNQERLRTLCINMSSDSIFNDFFTGKLKIDMKYYEIVKSQYYKSKELKINKKLNMHTEKAKNNLEYTKNKSKIINNEQNLMSVKELANELNITQTILRARIKKNCYDIASYVIRDMDKIFIQKEFLRHMIEIENNSKLIKFIAGEMKVEEKELKEICLLINKNTLFHDFRVNKYRIRNAYIQQIQDYYQDENKEYGRKIRAYFESNNNSGDKSLNMNNEINSAGKEKKIISLEKLADALNMHINSVYKRIKKNSYDIKDYVSYMNNKIYINEQFIDHINKVDSNSHFLESFASQIGIKKQTIIKIHPILGDDVVFADFRSNKFRINTKYLQQVKRYFKEDNEDIDYSKYIDIGQASDLLGVSNNSMKNIVRKGSTNDFFIRNNIIYISKNYINYILDIMESTISTKELAEMLGVSRHKIMALYLEEKIEVIKSPLNFSYYRIKKDQLKKISKLIEVKKSKGRIKFKKICDTAQDEFEVFDLIKKNIVLREYLRETENLFTSFVYDRLSNSDARKKIRYNIAKKCGRLLVYLNEKLDKEIYLYDNEEILRLINEIDNTNLIKTVKAFIKYCQDNTHCNYTSTFTCREVPKKVSVIDDEEIYSFELWGQYTKYLTDINLHINKAFESQRYACEWFLCILHLIAAWRLNDLITKIPNIELAIIDVYDFEWFKKGNEFTLSMGQSILNQMDMKLSGVCADKNEQQLRFFNSLNLTVPIAIAYVVAEIHRRKNSNNTIFSLLLDERYENETASWVRNAMSNFLKDERLRGFTNRKANNTLLTYVFECANTMEGMHSISYMLGGAMRSHKNDKKIQLPRTTQIYLKPILHKEDAKSVAFNLIKRGFFGWIPYKILQIIYNYEDGDSKPYMSNLTNEIVKLRENYSLLGMENLANHMTDELYEKSQIKVFNELARLDKLELKSRIKSILTCESASKSRNGGCLKGRVCAYPKRSSCSCCEYFVKNIYFLSSLNAEIIDLLNIIDCTDENEHYKIIKYSSVLFKLLSIVSEAKLFYEEYDSNLVDSFIEIDVIRDRIQDVRGKLKYFK